MLWNHANRVGTRYAMFEQVPVPLKPRVPLLPRRRYAMWLTFYRGDRYLYHAL